jgi:cellulose synthase (UDP-forming)
MWQRLCYLNSMSYWVFPLVRLILLVAPLVYLFFGLEIVVTTAPEAMAYMGSYLVIGYLVQNTLFSSVRWPFLSEIYEVAQAPYLIWAVIGAVLRPRSARFKVTSKDETITETRLSDVSKPLFMLFLLMLTGVGALAYRWFAFPGDRDVLQIVGAWVIFNTMLVAASLRALVEQRQRRKAPRVERIDAPALAEFIDEAGNRTEAACVITNVSHSGVRLAFPPRSLGHELRRPAVGERFRFIPTALVGSDDIGPVDCEIAHSGTADGRIMVGARFEPGQERGAYTAIASVLNGSSLRWQAIRARQTSTRRGLISGLFLAARLAVLGLYHTGAALLNSGPSRAGSHAGDEDAGWSAETPIEAQAFVHARGTVAFPARPRPRSNAFADGRDRRPSLEQPDEFGEEQRRLG